MSDQLMLQKENGQTLAGVSQAQVIESLVLNGDVSKLSSEERTAYYTQLCTSLGLNPLTKPFAVIKLNGKETMYALRDCTDQLRKLHRVSVTIASREKIADVYVVTARATLPDGRCDESIGAVPIANLKGDSLANALMKAETKSKRRVTLSIVGLGMLDETELDTIPSARPADGPRKKLEAIPAAPIEAEAPKDAPAELTAEQQIAAWEDIYSRVVTADDLAKVAAVVTQAKGIGVPDDVLKHVRKLHKEAAKKVGDK
jgi:hypothetical protein